MIGGRSTLIALCLCTLAAGQEFEVASVKLNKTDSPASSNFPLGPGDVYVPNGGRLAASGFPLVVYIAFAYKIAGNQAQTLVPQLPEWAKTDRYDIEARAQGNPGKDETRALMRALLADRFALKIHAESREVPALAFVLDKTGKTGPQLWPRTENGDCPTQSTPSAPGPVATGARGLPHCATEFLLCPPSPAI